ncbi:hypothetical protein [Acinetobacter sp.]|uniref:hypothetical protein n=1 Tax=Acinetobacter sp. TaxID=472 RepID=UPI00388D8B0E
MFLKVDHRKYMLVAVVWGLVGCNQPFEEPVAEQTERQNQVANSSTIDTQGNKLTEVAGKIPMPVADTTTEPQRKIAENAKPYVGRYQIAISCTDPIVKCKQGSADLVINLLADGTAYRSIIHLGKITFASNSYQRQDYWSYDSIHHQVIVHRLNGVDFFYNIDQDQNLVMELDKIAHASALNEQYFAEGNPFPRQPYCLVKETTSLKAHES